MIAEIYIYTNLHLKLKLQATIFFDLVVIAPARL